MAFDATMKRDKDLKISDAFSEASSVIDSRYELLKGLSHTQDELKGRILDMMQRFVVNTKAKEVLQSTLLGRSTGGSGISLKALCGVIPRTSTQLFTRLLNRSLRGQIIIDLYDFEEESRASFELIEGFDTSVRKANKACGMLYLLYCIS
jgi:hypothetical protein